MIMCTNDVEAALRKVPLLCKGSRESAIDEVLINGIVDLQPADGGYIDCTKMVGFEAVYRVCFGMTCFYWLFMLLMLCVRSSRDPRAGMQNGFWGIKFVIFIALIIASFFIPSEPFTKVWYVFGLIGGFLFIFIQLVLYIDFAFNTNDYMVSRMEDGDEQEQKCWFSLLIILTFGIYVACAVMIGFFFFYYGGFSTGQDADCGLHKFFLSFNMIICMVISVISVLPKIQEANPSSGLLQSAIVSFYVIYLTWSAMSNNPSPSCNPSLTKIFNITDGEDPNTVDPTKGITGYDSQSIVGLIIFFLAVMYSSIRNGGQGDRMGLGTETVVMTEPSQPLDGGESGKGQKVWDDEEETVQYNYSYFHMMFSMASLYIMMTLTYWFNIGAITEGTTKILGLAPVWIKIVSSWVCAALYTWTLIAPAILPDREWN